MKELETKNAKIERTMLGFEDHGILSFMLHLKYNEISGQGAGGYCLNAPKKDEEGVTKRVGVAAGMELIAEILRVVGVEKWEDLIDHPIRVKASQSKVSAIGNIYEDRWLNFNEFFERNHP